MKITIYELLGLVKDGKAPQKIKVGNKIYNYETFNIGKGDNYFTAEWEEVKGYRISYDGTYYYLEIRDYNLNEEVEIIEEPRDINVGGSWLTKSEYDEYLKGEEEKKIPEKINKNYDIRILDLDKPNTIKDYDMEQLIEMVQDIYDKQSEIIDYLKNKGDE